MDIRKQAELIRRGLLGRYITPAEAIAWADQAIAALPAPPVALIEFSLAAASQDPRDAANELAPLTAGIAEGDLLLETVADMQAALDRDEFRAEAIARDLYGTALQGVLPAHANLPDLYAVAHEFEEENAAWATSRDEALAYLRETLARLADALRTAA